MSCLNLHLKFIVCSFFQEWNFHLAFAFEQFVRKKCYLYLSIMYMDVLTVKSTLGVPTQSSQEKWLFFSHSLSESLNSLLYLLHKSNQATSLHSPLILFELNSVLHGFAFKLHILEDHNFEIRQVRVYNPFNSKSLHLVDWLRVYSVLVTMFFSFGFSLFYINK